MTPTMTMTMTKAARLVSRICLNMNKLLLGLPFLLLLCGCFDYPKHENSTPDSLQENTTEDSLSCYRFMNEIEDFVTNKCNDENMALVLYEKNDDGEYVIITTSNFYYTQNCYGYTFVNDKIVIFTNNNIGIPVVDTSTLIKDLPPDIYPNEFSDSVYDTFEPYGRKYLIHDNDNYELVFEGYW